MVTCFGVSPGIVAPIATNGSASSTPGSARAAASVPAGSTADELNGPVAPAAIAHSSAPVVLIVRSTSFTNAADNPASTSVIEKTSAVPSTAIRNRRLRH